MSGLDTAAGSRNTTQRPISPMRYQRVQQILSKEPAFAKEMRHKTAEVRGGGGVLKFSRLVYEVVKHVHAAGGDAYTVHRDTVLKTAVEVSGLLKQPEAKPEAAKPVEAKPAETQPVPEPVPEAKPEPIVAVEAPAAKPSKPKPKAAPRKAVQQKPKPAPEATTKPPVKAAPVKAAPEVKPVPKEKPEVVAIYSNISKLALVVGLKQMMDVDDDKFPGFEERRKAIDVLMNDYVRLRNVPSPMSFNLTATPAKNA